MTTQRSRRHYLALSSLILLAPATGSAQVVERDVSITGPRGNTIERRIRTERSGNVIDRQIDIKRPGGTYHRETEIIVPRGRGYSGGGPRPGPGFHGGPRVYGGPVVSPGFSFFFGSAPPPPPPIFVPAPPPVYVAAPSPVYVAAPSPPPPVVVDSVSEELENLDSFHSNHRRDGAIALGKYGDPRAVPALIDRLKHDHEKEVRQAAAWALAEIGDSRAIIPLEAAAQFDKRPDVRAVAAKSLARMPSELPRTSEPARVGVAPRDRASIESRPANSGSAKPSIPLDDEDVPPADPTPSARSVPDSGIDDRLPSR